MSSYVSLAVVIVIVADVQLKHGQGGPIAVRHNDIDCARDREVWVPTSIRIGTR